MQNIIVDNIVNDTVKLVQTKSVTGDTTKISAVYKSMLEEVGCTVKQHEFISDNPTLVARYGKAKQGEKKIIFNGHMDVVPLEHEDVYIEKNRIYGRGSCDMKGSLAVILEVIRSINRSKEKLQGEIIIIANSLHESPHGRGEDLEALIEKDNNLTADSAIVMEGATYDCTIAQIGSATFNLKIEREGEPSHQLFTPKGTAHPVSIMADIIKELDKKNTELEKEYIEDIGFGSYFIGNVSSGKFYNQTPKTAIIEGVRRYSPQQNFKDVKTELYHIVDKISKINNVSIEVDIRKVRDGYRINQEAPILQTLTNAIEKERDIKPPWIGKKLVTDAGILANGLGIPVVCSGPDQQRAHAEVEFVEINELFLTAKIYKNIIENSINFGE